MVKPSLDLRLALYSDSSLIDLLEQFSSISVPGLLADPTVVFSLDLTATFLGDVENALSDGLLAEVK